MLKDRGLLVPILGASLVYGAAALLFTAISILASPPESQLGNLRPLSSIPDHLSVLILLGLALATSSALIAGRKAIWLLVLIPLIVILTDLDHLPAAIGLAQPIRPAHSLIFITAAVAVTAIALRRPAIDAGMLSGFLAHLSADNGVFPPFAPITFDYYEVAEFRIPALSASVILAVLSGYILRRQMAEKSSN